jgi:hypothetical protein
MSCLRYEASFFLVEVLDSSLRQNDISKRNLRSIAFEIDPDPIDKPIKIAIALVRSRW